MEVSSLNLKPNCSARIFQDFFSPSQIHLCIHHEKPFTEHIPSMDGLLPVRPRRLLTDSSHPLSLMLMTSSSSNYLPPPNTPSPALKKITLPIPYSHLLHPTVPPPEVLATPLPNLQDIPTSPAWNPSLHTPCPGDDGENIHTIK
jgi:hypothetical protein